MGDIFVLSAPSGAGKSTLAKRLVANLPDLIFSVSCTTRQPREGEVDGVDYCFVDDSTFDHMVEEEAFLEWVQVYKHRYGTSRPWIEAQLKLGKDILLDIETIGAANVHRAMPEAITIFLLPPSPEELAHRLRGRGKDSEDQIRIRLNQARHEMEQMAHFDHLVLNDDLEVSYRNLEAIFLAARSRRARMLPRATRILGSFESLP